MRVRFALLLTLCAAILSMTLTSAAQPDRIESLLQSMTLKQKVGQMFLVALYGRPLNAPGRDFLREWQPGGVALFVSNAGTPEEVTALTNEWQQTVVDAGGVPLFVATDQEGGLIARLKDGFTTWPVPMLLTASGDLDIAQRVGAAMANELRAVGINMNLAPVADLYTNLRNPVIGRRSFGSDPVLTGRMLAATVRGLQAGGVMATAKHFPGHGDTDDDSHTSLPVVSHPRESLERIELEPFRWTISAGVESIMMSHIWYTAFDPQGETPASLSENIVRGLLRNDLRFRGLTMTDAIEMDAIDTRYSYAEASVQAIRAGIDIIAFGAHLGPNSQAQAMQAVIDAVERGEIPQSRIDDSVRRILDAKARYGILDWQPLDAATARSRMNSLEHARLVDELFHAGVTVAYDRIGAVPIAQERRVAVIYPGTRPAIRQSCEPLHNNIQWVTVDDTPTPDQINRAAQIARAADLAIVFTQNAEIVSAQQALVNALPADKTVAVALFSPYDWQAFPDVSAYVTTYSPLDPGVPAVCDVLFGRTPARGQLPVALDGVRDFAESAIRVERTNIPTALPESVVLAGVVAASTIAPQVSQTPTQTPSPTTTQPTSTREPLQAATRDPLSTAAPSTQVAAVLPTPQPTGITQTTAQEGESVPVWLIGSAGLVVIGLVGYISLVARGQKAAQRYREGFVITYCPVCGHDALKVRARTQNTLGIVSTRHTVTCEHCGSVLREVGVGRWKYRVNSATNPELHRRLNNKVIDDAALKKLSD